jgi:hypothetical protein
VIIPCGTPVGSYIPVTLAGGDTAVTEITNVYYASGAYTPESAYIIGREQGVRKLSDFKITPPKGIGKNYSGLLNHIIVTGADNLTTSILSPTLILTETTIDSSNFNVNNTNSPTKLSYLKVMIQNPTAGGLAGTVHIRLDTLASQAEFTDSFYVRVPKGQTVWYCTKYRFPPPRSMYITCLNLYGAKITIAEMLHGVAGRSINLFGLRATALTNADMDTQERIDSFSDGVIELNHSPKVQVSAVVKPRFVDTLDNAGNIIEFYDDILGTNARFLCTKQILRFAGTQVKEWIDAVRHNTSLEYTE